MRIAPKPVKGQEVSLDELLKSKPKQSDTAGVVVPIKDNADHWTLYGVQTMKGLMDIDMKKVTEQGTIPTSFLTRARLLFEEERATGRCRPITAYEFYAIAEFILNGLYYPDASRLNSRENLSAVFKDAHTALKAAWASGITTYTTIEYQDEQADTIAHLPRTCAETKIQSDVKFYQDQPSVSAENIARNVFGARDWSRVCRLYQEYYLTEPQLKQRPFDLPVLGPEVVYIESNMVNVRLRLTGNRPLNTIMVHARRAKEP